jgi:hypothetical protein
MDILQSTVSVKNVEGLITIDFSHSPQYEWWSIFPFGILEDVVLRKGVRQIHTITLSYTWILVPSERDSSRTRLYPESIWRGNHASYKNKIHVDHGNILSIQP